MSNPPRSPALLSCTAAALLLTAGCATTRNVHYYTLSAPTAPANPGKPDGPTILVATIETPEFLQDPRIHYRAGANEAGAYELHRWIERPGALVRDALVHALRASGQYRHVLVSTSSAVGDYLVRGRLHEFSEFDNAAIETRISLHLQLIDKTTNRAVWDRLYVHAEPSSGKTIKTVVESMDRNLQQVVSQAAAEIGAFLAGAPAPQ